MDNHVVTATLPIAMGDYPTEVQIDGKRISCLTYFRVESSMNHPTNVTITFLADEVIVNGEVLPGYIVEDEAE